MSAQAQRGAVKFLIVAGSAVFYGVVLLFSHDLSLYRAALYTAAVGVCIKLAWPTQEEGDALINDK